MKRWYKPHQTLIFLAPIIMMQDDGGCASTKAHYLSEIQIRQVIVGNTLQRADKSVFALIRADGTITAKLPNNVLDQGRWWILKTGDICVRWQTRADKKRHCAKVSSRGKNNYLWNDLKFKMFKGNFKNL